MPWKPTVPGEIPTLGYDAIDWIESFLAHPLGTGEPFYLYREQHELILKWYSINPKTGRFAYRRGLFGRPRGFGKSPIMAALAILEALAPIVPDGWDSDGQPVGRPWSDIRGEVLVQIAAVSQEQVRNTFDPLLAMVRDGEVMDEYPGLEPMNTMITLPFGGSIKQITASARTVKGAPPVLAIADQTEEWVPSNGGTALARVMRDNATKGAVVAGRLIESPNAHTPGENSVAEETANAFLAIQEGRTKSRGVLVDHREAPAETDMSKYSSLIEGLRIAYGDASAHPKGCAIHNPPCPPGHKDLDELVEGIWDASTDPQEARANFLNQVTHASDSWLSKPQVDAAEARSKSIETTEAITLGFDGSRGRVKGKADATALIGCRVSDGHFFQIGVWEQPMGETGKDWVVPQSDVDRTIRDVLERYHVVGFYADPAGWVSQIARLEADYGFMMDVKATRENPFTVWPTSSGQKGKAVSQAVEELRAAIVNRDVTHDGSSALTRHLLNARRRKTKTGYLLYKQYPDSPDKIDSAYAMTLAYKARNDALSKGSDIEEMPSIPQRIR